MSTTKGAVCPKCYQPVAPGALLCMNCGQSLQVDPGFKRGPAILVRTYRGNQRDAARLMQKDAGDLSQQGYRIVGQTYAPGGYSPAAFIVALLLCLFLIGILIFAYMLIVKPAGTLTVTYQRT